MRLEDYFDFLGIDDIRIKGHRIGIDDVLSYYLEGFSAEETPPTFLEIEPACTFGNEDLVNSRMSVQPCHNRRALVAGEIVCDHVEIAIRIGLIDRVQQAHIAGGVARTRRQRQFVPIAHPQRSIDPDFLRPPTVLQGHFDPMVIRSPI